MNRILAMPVLAALLFAAACGGADGPTEVDTRPSVRFVNATTGSGSGGFTTNGQFAIGSAVAPGQAGDYDAPRAVALSATDDNPCHTPHITSPVASPALTSGRPSRHTATRSQAPMTTSA